MKTDDSIDVSPAWRSAILLTAKLSPLLSRGHVPLAQEGAGKVRDHWEWKLLAAALLAISVALMLSPSKMSVWAWYQSPVSPILSTPTQSPHTPTPSPTILAATPTPTPGTPVPVAGQPSQTSGLGANTLIAGGIVLVGLIVGAVVFLIRGQPSDESTP